MSVSTARESELPFVVALTSRPPAAMTIELPLAREPPPPLPICRVPPLMIVPPVKALLAVSTSVPSPDLVREPEPERTPLKVPSTELVTVSVLKAARLAVALTVPPVREIAFTVPQD